MADPDDIIREIDETDENEVYSEFERLKRKRRGFRAALTEIKNNITNLINASRGAAGELDKSEANRNALQRAREKLEIRYEKLQRIESRLLSLTVSEENVEILEKNIKIHTKEYNECITNLGALSLDMQAQQNQVALNEEDQTLTLKPIQALKPSFILSFDHSPTELAAWMLQFRSYFDASKIQNVPVSQQ